jgi:hypothetical protein
VAENVDREALLRLIDDGPPDDLPVVRLQASGFRLQQSAGDYDVSVPEEAPFANRETPEADCSASDGANGIQDLKAGP